MLLNEIAATIGKMRTYSRNELEMSNVIKEICLSDDAWNIFKDELTKSVNQYTSRGVFSDRKLMGVKITSESAKNDCLKKDYFVRDPDEILEGSNQRSDLKNMIGYIWSLAINDPTFRSDHYNELIDKFFKKYSDSGI